MSPYEYQQLAVATAKSTVLNNENLAHAGLGIAGEAGETADMIKKHVIFGKPLDKEKLSKELGDVLWYVALTCEILGLQMENVMAENIKKLRERHKTGSYSAEAQIAQADTRVSAAEQISG